MESHRIIELSIDTYVRSVSTPTTWVFVPVQGRRQRRVVDRRKCEHLIREHTSAEQAFIAGGADDVAAIVPNQAVFYYFVSMSYVVGMKI